MAAEDPIERLQAAEDLRDGLQAKLDALDQVDEDPDWSEDDRVKLTEQRGDLIEQIDMADLEVHRAQLAFYEAEGDRAEVERLKEARRKRDRTIDRAVYEARRSSSP